MEIRGTRRPKKEGWIQVYVHGSPFERGYAHGKLLHAELLQVIGLFPFLVEEFFHVSVRTYLKDCQKIHDVVQDKYPEIYLELTGIVSGFSSTQPHKKMTIEFLIAWNSTTSMFNYYRPAKSREHCSAFIATGNATEDGKIVMAHNTHSDYACRRVSNIIMRMKPDRGEEMLFQTLPGYICSSLDWFVCGNGMIGCETTIGDFKLKPVFGRPYWCRIREAMQYGSNLTDYARIMKHDNAGDYSCSWLFGDTRTNEIMLCEIGFKKFHLQKKRNGVFYGMNAAIDRDLRKMETVDKTYWDTSDTSGARNVRLHVLLYETYMGKINAKIAQTIISDHYDVFYDKPTFGNSLTICRHSEKDEQVDLYGAIDGKVVTSNMAKRMCFLGVYGSSCGRRFSKTEFFKKNPKWSKKWEPFVDNVPAYDWVELD